MRSSSLRHTLSLAATLCLLGAPAMAQSADKDASTRAKQADAKSSATKAAASKRLDFVPSNAVKQTTTRPTGAQPATAPAKQDWHCDHSQASDA